MGVVPNLDVASREAELCGLLRMAETHSNVERKTLHEFYRRNNDGSLPDWKLEESESLEVHRWQR